MTTDQLWADLHLALRGLWRARGFSLAAIGTLALGIAGTTVMFALIQGVLLRPLAVHQQERLLVAWKTLPSTGFSHYPFGDAEIEDVARASQLVESVAGVTSNGVGRWVVVEGGVASYVKGALVTGGFFDVLGVEPILGRAFTRADDVDGAEQAVVISHGFWQRRYGGARDVVGRRVTLGEQLVVIAGVVPELEYPEGVELWRTPRSVPSGGPFGDAARREVDLVARLRPGVTIEQATSELAILTERIEAAATDNRPRGLIPVVQSFEDVVVGDVRTTMLVLFIAVGLVLLIASANVANLLLVRGESRQSELAVRTALGAGHGRIVRQLLAESIVLTLAAGVIGLVVTRWSLPVLVALVPDGLPRLDSVRIDASVVLFTLGTAFVTALLAGLAPAFTSARLNLVSTLRNGGRSIAGSATRRSRRSLVVAQVALAVTIVTVAGLLTQTLLHLQSVDLGLAAERLVFVELSVPYAKVRDRARHSQFLDAVVAELDASPAVAAATPVNVPPFSGTGGWDVPRFTGEGQTAERASANPSLNLESVHANYFETFEVPLVRGRWFTTADREGAPAVAIVSQDVADLTWPGQDPIGKRLKMGGPDSRGEWRTVVGVATPTRYRELAKPRATLYLPARQFQMTAQLLALRTTASLELIASLARDGVAKVDPDVQVMRVQPFTAMLNAPLARPRFNAFLLNIFAGAALLLATVGLAAVMAAYVRQRDREIGIRVALGASPSQVRALVLGEALWLAGLGSAIGLAGAIGATRLAHSLLFQVDPLDPWTMIGAALLLMTASAMASYLPVRRATRLDTVSMLRE